MEHDLTIDGYRHESPPYGHDRWITGQRQQGACIDHARVRPAAESDARLVSAR
jgi:hypothetical protein